MKLAVKSYYRRQLQPESSAGSRLVSRYSMLGGKKEKPLSHCFCLCWCRSSSLALLDPLPFAMLIASKIMSAQSLSSLPNNPRA